jgi:hypothetical protein
LPEIELPAIEMPQTELLKIEVPEIKLLEVLPFLLVQPEEERFRIGEPLNFLLVSR